MNYSSETDSQIISRILEEENKDLYSLLYNRYIDKVRGKCWTLVRSKDVAEDLTQDIFLKAFENLAKFRQTSTFATWLYSITYNHCIEYLRKHKRIRFDNWSDSLDLPEEVEDTEILQIIQQREERVTLILEMLRPADKALLIMKYKDGMKLKTMMEIMKLEGESAVKMKLNRAKKRVVALYQEIFGDLNKEM